MTTRIQLRRGTAAQWTDADPVLALGEAGIELDTLLWKVGDGMTAWSVLPYMESANENFENVYVSGNAVVGSLFTDNYFYANGAPISFTADTGNIVFNNTYISVADETSDITLDPSNDNGNTEFIVIPGPANANSIPLYVSNQMEGGVTIESYGNQWQFNPDGTLTVPLSVGAASNQLKYGLGNLIAWNDGGWTIGEYNGDITGTEGIRINPDIEGPVDITLPSTQAANSQPTSISNFLGNVVINSGSNYVSHQWKFDDTGNLILPDTANIGINYANGAPYGGGGGGNADIGNWVFDANDATANNSGYPRLYGGPNGGPEFSYLEEAGNNASYSQTMYINNEDGFFVSLDYGNAQFQFATSGNTYLPGNVSATGNITAGNLATSGSGGALEMTGGDITGANSIVLANSVTTNGSGGNIVLTGGNISGANTVIADNFATTGVAGNITGANVISAVTFTATGNVISDTAVVSNTYVGGGNIYIKPDGSNNNAYLDVYLTAGPDIHIAANSENLILGRDSGANVTVDINGNTTVRANGGTAYDWRFGNQGDLALATTNVDLQGSGSGESAKLTGTRRIVNGLGQSKTYSAVLNAGGTPTVAYTAIDSNTTSVKVTFAVQSNGAFFNWEQFDVVVVEDQGNLGDVILVVSNRVNGNYNLANTAVTAAINGSGQIEISLNLDAQQVSGGWSSFDAVEFGTMVD